MAKFAHADVLDGGLSAIKNAATKMILVSEYATTDSYANVQTNLLAEVTMTDTDFTLSTSGTSRLCTSASGKSAVASASAAGTPDLHIVFTNGTDKILWATDETSNQAIVSGNTVNFPALVYTSQQPT